MFRVNNTVADVIAQKNTFHFLPSGGGGVYFWEVVVGVCRPALQGSTPRLSSTLKN